MKAVSGDQSGITIHGEQRSAGVTDYNLDGRPDLLVTQNGGQTILFENRKSKPGFRVRFIGSEKNPDAVGMSYRVLYGGKSGPLREIQAGTGYWSQNSYVQTIPASDEKSLVFDILRPDGQRIERRIEAASDRVNIVRLYE